MTALIPRFQLMPSALVHVFNTKNEMIKCRALLDTGASANFITQRLADKLSLPRTNYVMTVGALNSLTTTTKHMMKISFRSLYNDFKKTLTFLTVPSIIDLLPNETIPRDSISIPKNIRLADPEFHQPKEINMLLGCGPTLSLLCLGQINLSANGVDLYLHKTRLGWVIAGGLGKTPGKHAPSTCMLGDVNFDLGKFWELEELSHGSRFSQEEIACEHHFSSNVEREKDGRYVVALPFKGGIEELGESRNMALKRFLALERKFAHDRELMTQYSEVIQEYIDLGHMSPVIDDLNQNGFFLPHHAVIKRSSLTTKVRVVFDGSAKSSSGISLNEKLMVGPVIQDDIFSLLLRFRTHNYVFTADIEKMYRQFLVRESDRKYQRILWRMNSEIQTFELNTVTFGLASSSFLAIRCLHQLANDHQDEYPRAAKILKKDLYVDDVISGAETISEANSIIQEIISLLKYARLNIRQWASNVPEVLNGIENININPKYDLDKDASLKTLGVYWAAKTDTLVYTVSPIPLDSRISKRVILSEIARIFDPLGLLGPIILLAKQIIQQLWLLKLQWDESIPVDIHSQWSRFVTELTSISNFSITRRIVPTNALIVELHGFCDASERGYGACIFIRSQDSFGNCSVILYCSKSRVAPLKTVSIPRLELSGAQLLAKLYSSVIKSVKLPISRSFFWTDSTITLHWVNTSPHLLKTFVANRVTEIQAQTEAKQWRHVPSEDNPSDALSRGQFPKEFTKNKLWTQGPKWLSQDESFWPKHFLKPIKNVPELQKKYCLMASMDETFLTKYSNFTSLKRNMSWVLRFINNIKFVPKKMYLIMKNSIIKI